jgi:hypothetical protein
MSHEPAAACEGFQMIAAPHIIEQARRVRIEHEIARRGIRLKREGRELVGACPRCGGINRFGVNPKKQVFNCRKCIVGGDVIDLVRHIDGCTFIEAVEMLTGNHVRPQATSASIEPTKPLHDDGFWRAIWKESVAPQGTLVEPYLAGRHLLLPERASESLRFHSHCPFGKNEHGGWIYTPAMIALVRNVITNAPQAIHRTALDQHGDKRDDLGNNGRLSLGPTKDGAIKLTPDDLITTALGVGEGIETTLSLQRVPEWLGSPVWSLISSVNLASFPVLPGIDVLTVAVDNDEPGKKAARSSGDRWYAAGRTVFFTTPLRPNADLNDLSLLKKGSPGQTTGALR